MAAPRCVARRPHHEARAGAAARGASVPQPHTRAHAPHGGTLTRPPPSPWPAGPPLPPLTFSAADGGPRPLLLLCPASDVAIGPRAGLKYLACLGYVCVLGWSAASECRTGWASASACSSKRKASRCSSSFLCMQPLIEYWSSGACFLGSTGIVRGFGRFLP